MLRFLDGLPKAVEREGFQQIIDCAPIESFNGVFGVSGCENDQRWLR